MDTREKIVVSEAARALLGEGAWVVIAGLFDPLTALQAKRLSGLRRPGRKLMAIVEHGENPLLNAEARAALIAALRGVDAVSIADSARSILPLSSSVELIEDTAGEFARSADFVRFILDRQQVSGNA
ncbi:MAG: hypothetical protein M3Y57_04045 [Acidobacteriota bacterium]|nr:hypothetical protein [Acidobacteriota bacterium]